METTTVKSFLDYYSRIRKITDKVVQLIPADQLDFSYMTGKFTIGDLVRHIAAVERNLFAEVVVGRPSCYHGCGKELADGYDNIVAYYDEMHRQSMDIFSGLKDEDMARSITTLNGKTTDTGNFLKALIVHEVHHRAAMCIYLNMLGIKTPPVLGLTEEQVIQHSK